MRRAILPERLDSVLLERGEQRGANRREAHEAISRQRRSPALRRRCCRTAKSVGVSPICAGCA